ncbi:MAG: acetyl-CoA C-acyltransferase [Verrucomicrobiota bacterium]
MKEPIYIVEGVRTPFCKMGTEFADLDAVELGRVAVSQLLARVDLDAGEIAEVILGCVGQPSDAANVGRVVAMRAGVPETVPAITVHRNCASGFEAITQAHEKLIAGRGEVFVAGGTESMSKIPLLFEEKTAAKFAKLGRAKSLGPKLGVMAGFRPKDFAPRIGLMEGLTDPVCGLNMGQTAELVARDFGISREEQDEFSMRSHHKAEVARERLQEEIVDVLDGRSGVVSNDNGVREGQNMKALEKLRPVFDRREGRVTAGNASQITDGAVALLLMSASAVERHGFEPLGCLTHASYAGCDPTRMGLGPVHAIARGEAHGAWKMEEADLIEINEAFAAQVIGCQRAALDENYCRDEVGLNGVLGEIPDEKLNVNGGAVALGHPVGATGSRLVLTALKELKRRGGKKALVSLCVGGGQGGALWLEAA